MGSFSTSHVPYGHYDLCVVPNGISSHCVSFCHHRPKKPCDYHSVNRDCDTRLRRETCEEDLCCVEDLEVDPEIAELKDEVKRLQRTIERVASRVKTEAPIRQPKEITKKMGKAGVKSIKIMTKKEKHKNIHTGTTNGAKLVEKNRARTFHGQK
jgi:hypothetical protein